MANDSDFKGRRWLKGRQKTTEGHRVCVKINKLNCLHILKSLSKKVFLSRCLPFGSCIDGVYVCVREMDRDRERFEEKH